MTCAELKTSAHSSSTDTHSLSQKPSNLAAVPSSSLTHSTVSSSSTSLFPSLPNATHAHTSSAPASAVLVDQQPVPDSQTTFLVRCYINHTKKVVLFTISIPLICALLAIFTNVINIKPIKLTHFYIRNDVRTRLDDARTAALRDFSYNEIDPPESVNNLSTVYIRQEQNTRARVESRRSYSLFLLVRGKSRDTGRVASSDAHENTFNVVSRDALSLLKHAEDVIFDDPEFRHFCLHDPNERDCDRNVPHCAIPFSVLLEPSLYGKPSPNNSLLFCGRRKGYQPVSKQSFNQFLSKLTVQGYRANPIASIFFTKDLTAQNRKAWGVGSFVRVGSPFEDMPSGADGVDAYYEYVKWARKITEQIRSLSNDQYSAIAVGLTYIASLFEVALQRDMRFVAGAVLLVLLGMWFLTGSLFLAIVGMLQIFLAIPTSFVVYHFIFRQFYIGAFHAIIVFLLLGIGADDVFVFTSAWKQAKASCGPTADLTILFNKSYYRSVRTTAVTSFTTAAAFFITATSPIMPIRTLGIWGGLLFIFQFSFCAMLFPCALVMQYRFWKQRWPGMKIDGPLLAFRSKICSHMRSCHLFCIRPRRDERESCGSELQRRCNVEGFFSGPWFSIVRKGRYVFTLLAFVFVLVCVWLTAKLETPQEEEHFLRPSDPNIVALKDLEEGFPPIDPSRQLQVKLTWGIKDVDRSGTSPFQPDDPGRPVLDETFDFTTAAAQQHVYDTCRSLRLKKDLIFDKITLPPPVDCWIELFAIWRRLQLGENDFEDYASGKHQVDQLRNFSNADAFEILKTLKKETNSSAYDPERYFSQAGALKGITRRYLTEQHFAFDENGTRVVFTEIHFVSKVGSRVPRKVMRPTYDSWQDFVRRLNAEAPSGMDAAIATSGFSWKYMITQEVMVSSMIKGVIVMFSVSFITLSIFTMNWVVGIIATLCIFGIITMLFGLIRLFGWHIGTVESFGVILSIGYSLDGAAHIATAYVECDEDGREERTKAALTDMGVPLINSAVTTVLAGSMLLPATIVFFMTFSILIIVTVALGLIWSLVFFPALLLLCGPSSRFGSLHPVVQSVKHCFQRCTRSDSLVNLESAT